MPNRPDDPNDRRARRPADHIASKHDAFQSAKVQALVKNMLIVSPSSAKARLLISLLRAILGRTVEARVAIGVDAAIAALAGASSNLILLRDASDSIEDKPMPAVADVTRLRDAGCQAAIIVICNDLSARDAISLRRAGAHDVITIDDLSSLALFESLQTVTKRPHTDSTKLAWLK
jgi:hypothetical protein